MSIRYDELERWWKRLISFVCIPHSLGPTHTHLKAETPFERYSETPVTALLTAETAEPKADGAVEVVSAMAIHDGGSSAV